MNVLVKLPIIATKYQNCESSERMAMWLLLCANTKKAPQRQVYQCNCVKQACAFVCVCAFYNIHVTLTVDIIFMYLFSYCFVHIYTLAIRSYSSFLECLLSVLYTSDSHKYYKNKRSNDVWTYWVNNSYLCVCMNMCEMPVAKLYHINKNKSPNKYGVV